MSRARLNPCPFCGARWQGEYAIDADRVGGGKRAVVCSACSAQGPFINPATGEDNLTEAAARVAWNCRH